MINLSISDQYCFDSGITYFSCRLQCRKIIHLFFDIWWCVKQNPIHTIWTDSNWRLGTSACFYCSFTHTFAVIAVAIPLWKASAGAWSHDMYVHISLSCRLFSKLHWSIKDSHRNVKQSDLLVGWRCPGSSPRTHIWSLNLNGCRYTWLLQNRNACLNILV